MGGLELSEDKRKAPRVKAKAPGKAVRGRMPTKRSINLILVDENKISAPRAILGIIVILALAAAFSKFLVMDRLIAVSEAHGKVTRIRTELNEARGLMDRFGDVENTYAHYTYAGMTQAELDLVDRNMVLDLVGSMLPNGETSLSPQEYQARLIGLIEDAKAEGEDAMTPEAFTDQFWSLLKRVVPQGYTVKNWSLSQNLLTVSVTGTTLQRLNRLARLLEQQPIVDSCAITTANKNVPENTGEPVQAQLIIYLRKPPEMPSEEATTP